MTQDPRAAVPTQTRSPDVGFDEPQVVPFEPSDMRGAADGISVLLLSGGVDSAALAYALRPAYTLFVDYGQRPAVAESRAARAVAKELGLEHAQVTVNLESVGAGLLHDGETRPGWPSPEWWPFRNQFLVTIAGAWLVGALDALDFSGSSPMVLTGTVASDGSRHRDGTEGFYTALDALMRCQEGGFGVAAPALRVSTERLVEDSGVTDAVLGWTHSCHTSRFPCGDCPGCFKRARVLGELGRLQ